MPRGSIHNRGMAHGEPRPIFDSVMAAKESLLRGMDLGLGMGLEKAIEIYKTVYDSEDAQEGPRAFSEKRKPVWKGR